MVDLQFAFINRDGNQITDWVSCDINQDIAIPTNLQITDYQDPTVTKNNYSTQINIPRTKLNNHIFNQMWRLDHIQDIDDYIPLYKNKFRFYVNSTIFQTGYFKVETITEDSYTIRLYGELGAFFNNIDEKLESGNDFQLKNLFNGVTDPFIHQITKDYIVGDFSSSNYNAKTYFDYSVGQSITKSPLHYVLSYQGKYDNFDTSKIITDTSGTETSILEVAWTDITSGRQWAVPELSENERQEISGTNKITGEYRSYYQRPAISYHLVLNSMFSKIERELGYTVKLDPSFFNDYNPYWKDLYFINNQYNTNTGDVTTLSYKLGTTSVTIPRNLAQVTIPLTNPTGQLVNDANIRLDIPFKLRNNQGIDPYDGITIYQKNPLELVFRLKIDWTDSTGSHTKYLDVTALSEGENTNTLTFNQSNTLGMRETNRLYYLTRPDTGVSISVGSDYHIVYTGSSTLPDSSTITGLSILVDSYGSTDWKQQDGSKTWNTSLSMIFPNTDDSVIKFGNDSEDTSIRSGATITWGKDNAIITSDITCKDFLLSYTKLFGLMFDMDFHKKTVTIMTRKTWYSEVTDWTTLIDYNQHYEQRILPFEYRYGKFNYKPLDSKYEQIYKEKFGRDYGSFLYDTGYRINTETQNYLESSIFNNGVFATDVNKYFAGRANQLYSDNKNLPSLEDKGGDSVGGEYIPVFLVGLQSLADSTHRFMVSDDTPSMQTTLGYTWIQATSSNSAYYNLLSQYQAFNGNLQRGNTTYSIYFGVPQEEYERDPVEVTAYSALYQRFWARYVRDKYNANNRIFSCFVDLSDQEVLPSILRKFVYIDGSYWVINRLLNYNPNSYQPTQVELIKVTDRANYTIQDYPEGYLRWTVDSYTKPDGTTGSTYLLVNENPLSDDGVGSKDIEIRAGSSLQTSILSDLTDWTIIEASGMSLSLLTGGHINNGVANPVTDTITITNTSTYPGTYPIIVEQAGRIITINIITK